MDSYTGHYLVQSVRDSNDKDIQLKSVAPYFIQCSFYVFGF